LLPVLIVAGVLAIVVAAVILWSTADRWRLSRLEPVAVAGLLYGRLRRHGGLLAVPVRAGDTPYEFERTFAKRMATLSQGTRRGAILAPAASSATKLIDLYVRASYGSAPASENEPSQALKTWRDLRWRLWLARLWGRSSHWIDERTEQ
jgi:hypothetical protein